MKSARNLILAAGVALLAAYPGLPATFPDASGASTKIVVTVQPSHGNALPATLEGDDLSVVIGKTRARILRSEPLTGDSGRMQFFILLDDSTRSSSLGTQLPDLKAFVQALPAGTQVAVGYMRNGMASVVQPFTGDHEKAAASLRLPQSVPGGNGSPYFALSDLAKHWPSKEAAGRRVVLMLTDGVDRYYGNSTVDDPYVTSAIHDAVKQDLIVYSIYLRDTGLYDLGSQTTLFAQSRLKLVADATGGYAYFQAFTDPVSVKPFLNDFQDRLNRQFQITVEARNHGLQSMQVHSERPGLKIQGPTRIYVQ
ncbi:MAG TPA: hypothetical protein VFW44_03785 [Bryobacteraceae bacterium]|nr:hypothetical protein [Bryobacteraceae bacterium]